MMELWDGRVATFFLLPSFFVGGLWLVRWLACLNEELWGKIRGIQGIIYTRRTLPGIPTIFRGFWKDRGHGLQRSAEVQVA